MSLDLHCLEKVKQRGEKFVARCPACAEDGRDSKGEHLVIFADGRFACSPNAGDQEHRRRIFAIAGIKENSSPLPWPMAPPLRIRRKEISSIEPQEPELPKDFAQITTEARSLLARSIKAQEFAAGELGISRATVAACTMPSGGALGFFPSIPINGRPCLPNRLGYIYPKGIKLRNPWGSPGARFSWVCGKATEPWRYTVAAWRAWITRFIITEGESDTLALIDAGVGCLCEGDTAVVASPGTSFLASWAPLMRGKHVTLCFDCDDAGQAASQKAAALIHPYAASIKIQTGWRTTHHE